MLQPPPVTKSTPTQRLERASRVRSVHAADAQRPYLGALTQPLYAHGDLPGLFLVQHEEVFLALLISYCCPQDVKALASPLPSLSGRRRDVSIFKFCVAQAKTTAIFASTQHFGQVGISFVPGERLRGAPVCRTGTLIRHFLKQAGRMVRGIRRGRSSSGIQAVRGAPYLDQLQRPGLDVPLALRDAADVVVDEEAFGCYAEYQPVCDCTKPRHELACRCLGKLVHEQIDSPDDNLIGILRRVRTAHARRRGRSRSGG